MRRVSVVCALIRMTDSTDRSARRIFISMRKDKLVFVSHASAFELLPDKTTQMSPGTFEGYGEQKASEQHVRSFSISIAVFSHGKVTSSGDDAFLLHMINDRTFEAKR